MSRRRRRTCARGAVRRGAVGAGRRGGGRRGGLGRRARTPAEAAARVVAARRVLVDRQDAVLFAVMVLGPGDESGVVPGPRVAGAAALGGRGVREDLLVERARAGDALFVEVGRRRRRPPRRAFPARGLQERRPVAGEAGPEGGARRVGVPPLDLGGRPHAYGLRHRVEGVEPRPCERRAHRRAVVVLHGDPVALVRRRHALRRAVLRVGHPPVAALRHAEQERG